MPVKAEEYKVTFCLLQNVHGSVYVKKLVIVIFSYLDWQKSNTGSVHQVIRVEENNQTIFLSWKLFQVIS